MRSLQNHASKFVVALVFLAVIGLVASTAPCVSQAQPTVAIDEAPNLPPGDGPMGTISGRAGGVDFNKHKICLYARGGGVLWVQPYVAAPDTTMEADGSWNTDTHGGDEYVALLVRQSYRASPQLPSIPRVGGDILAVATKVPSRGSQAAKVGAAKPVIADKPGIELMAVPNIPPGDGPMGSISGRVSGVDPSKCKICIYARGGGVFWVQPYAAAPDTNIRPDGTFDAETRGGDEYMALLVQRSFKAQAQLSSKPNIGGDVLAIATKVPSKSR